METALAIAPKPSKRPPSSRRRWQGGSIIARGKTFSIAYRAGGVQKWESGFPTKSVARKRLNEALGKISNGTFVETQDKLFSDWCTEWLLTKERQLKPQTFTSYSSAVKVWFKPHFGERWVRDITRPDVTRFFQGLAAQNSKYGKRRLTHKFIRNLHTLLHMMFDDAMRLEYAGINPAHLIKLDGLGEDSTERRVPKQADVVKTFAHLNSTYQVLFSTGAVCGLRRGELLALRWPDVNLEMGMLTVSRGLQRVKRSRLDANAHKGVERIGNSGLALLSPKSKKSIREVEIPSKLGELLRALRRSQSGDSRFLFQDELGRPLDPDTIYEPLHLAQDAAKVERFGLHGLRHLYCSLLQESAGASLTHAQKRMGHASASTTLGYTHSIEPEGRKYAELVEAEFPFAANCCLLLANGSAEGSQQVAESVSK